jgi:hypothetical protein
MRILRFLSFLAILTGCGYTLNTVPGFNDAPTISIPYVEGDVDGQLTAALIQQVSISGEYVYRASGGEYTLAARIIDDTYENIGFRYDRSRKGCLKHYIIPVEMREGLLIEVQVIASCSGETILGPNRLYADLEYDHDYYSIRDGINVKSLGQLTDIDSAEDAAKTPLYRKLAEKVVSWLIYSL